MENIFSSNHHAFLFLGNRKGRFAELKEFFNTAFEKGEIFPADVLALEKISWTIDDSHFIDSWEKRVALGDKKYVLISAFSLTTDSQNALLKVIEDARATKFIIITDTTESLLPTLRSRLFLAGVNFEEADFDVKLFLKTNPAKRASISFIKKLISEKNEEDKQDREKALLFLRALEPFVKESLEMARDKRRWVASARDLFSAKRYLRSHGSSPKLIVEYLSLTLPTVT